MTEASRRGSLRSPAPVPWAGCDGENSVLTAAFGVAST